MWTQNLQNKITVGIHSDTRHADQLRQAIPGKELCISLDGQPRPMQCVFLSSSGKVSDS